jgi:hypothetical protein
VEEPLGLVRGDAQPLVVQIEGFDSFVESLKRESRRGEACPGVASKQLGEGARS